MCCGSALPCVGFGPSGVAIPCPQPHLFELPLEALHSLQEGIDGCATGSYLTDAIGQRSFAYHGNGTWTEPVYLNGQVMADLAQDGTWTDYIHANGQKIAKAVSTKPILHLHGIRDSSNNLGCGVEGAVSGVPGVVVGYTVQQGDQMMMSINQNLPTYSGLALIFTNDTGTGALTDTASGTPFYFNGVADSQWHSMVGDLSPYAGLQISYILAGIHNSTPPGTFDLYLTDAVIHTAAGAVLPILTGQSASVPPFNGTTCGAHDMISVTEITPVSDPKVNTAFYLADQVGTTQVETGGGGWPLWQGQFAPFGQEIVGGSFSNSLGALPYDGSSMRYKFTGKERDVESGLDNFGARYYGSSLGRFVSPDPSKLSVLLPYPQTWNRYSYVYNNPLSLKDENGKWPKSTHNQIIDNAFPNLSPAQRQILKNVSANQDGILNGGQSKELSYEHAMRAPGQSAEDAQAKYSDFVSTEEAAANNLQIYLSDPDTEMTQINPESLAAFGRALHAIEDSLSPAHAGFQVWDYNLIYVLHHHNAENSINGQMMQNAVNAARNAFNSTYLFFGFTAGSNPTVTTSQHDNLPCSADADPACK